MKRIVNVLDKAPKTGVGSVPESTMERAKSQVGDRRRLQTESILSMARRRIPHRASTATEDKKEDEGREKSVEKMNKFVDGLGSATAAVGGITAAIAGFDLEIRWLLWFHWGCGTGGIDCVNCFWVGSVY